MTRTTLRTTWVAALAALSQAWAHAGDPPSAGRNSAKLSCAFGLKTHLPPFKSEIAKLPLAFGMGGTSQGRERFLVLPAERNSQPGFYVYAEDKTYFVPAASEDDLSDSGIAPETASGKKVNLRQPPNGPTYYRVEQWFKLPGETLARNIHYVREELAQDTHPKPNLIPGDPAIEHAGGARSSPHVVATGRRAKVLEISDQSTESSFQRALEDQVEAIFEQAQEVNALHSSSATLAQEKLDFRNFAIARIWDCLDAAAPEVKQKIEATIRRIARPGDLPSGEASEFLRSSASLGS